MPNHKRGRGNKVALDINQIRQLAMLGCTQREIARVMDIDEKTLRRHKVEGPVADAIAEGRAHQCLSVRRTLMKGVANGNVAMTIFMAKNILGYRDVSDMRYTISGPDGGPIEVDHNHDAKERLLRKLDSIADRLAAQSGDSGDAGGRD